MLEVTGKSKEMQANTQRDLSFRQPFDFQVLEGQKIVISDTRPAHADRVFTCESRFWSCYHRARDVSMDIHNENLLIAGCQKSMYGIRYEINNHPKIKTCKMQKQGMELTRSLLRHLALPLRWPHSSLSALRLTSIDLCLLRLLRVIFLLLLSLDYY